MIRKHSFSFVSCIYVYHDKDRQSAAMINNDSHLLHITKGNASVRIGDADIFEVTRGDVISIPVKTTFYMTIKAGFEMINLHYIMRFENGEHMDGSLRLPYHFRPAYFDRIETGLRELYDMSKDDQNYFQTAATAYSIIMGHYSAQALVKIHKLPRDEKIHEAARYLSSKECKRFDPAKLAYISCLSISQLNRRFGAEFGNSPHAYWDDNRLKSICVKLKYSDMSIGSISDEFEFSSPYYFSRWFKKKTGHTPLEYRKDIFDY